jgi:hypothetical protein
MTGSIPMVRHGVASTTDARLAETLSIAQGLGVDPARGLVSLLDYDGQLWATWRDTAARAAGAGGLTRAWAEAGGERGALHLVPSEEDYDYQEDCMNDGS